MADTVYDWLPNHESTEGDGNSNFDEEAQS